MRSTWPLIAGIIVALQVALLILPIVAATAGLIALAGRSGPDRTILGGGSRFVMSDEGGRITTRMANTTYSQITVPVVGDPRPRRLLLRQWVELDSEGEGRARLDAWPIGAPIDLRRPPVYTIRAPAHAAGLGDDGLFWTERGGRRTVWSLADGGWLFESDLPLAGFAIEPDQRRLVGLAVADEELWSRGAVAVLTYAAPGRVLRRALLFAESPLRANALRATITASRLASFTDPPSGGRVIELPLAAGPVRVPVGTTDLDLAHAAVPAGLKLVPLHPWDG